MLSNSFKWKHFVGEIILLNVRWYLKYPLSYRNLKEMMAERGGFRCKKSDHFIKSLKAFTIKNVNQSHHQENGTKGKNYSIKLRKYYFCTTTLPYELSTTALLLMHLIIGLL